MAVQNNIHIPLTKLRPKPDLSKAPDIKDPNNYCISCDYTFKSKDCYHIHLVKIHHMSLLGPPKEPDKAKNTHPTIDIVNLYCDACNRKYSVKSSYVRHLIYFHGVKLPDIYSERSNFDSKKLYCKVCDTKYANRDSFTKHLKIIHHVEPRSGPIPDINNPNNYCITCDKTLYSRLTYLNHLCSFHLDEVPELYQGIDCPSPSKKDIRYKRYCTDCKKVFPFNHIYRIHVDKIHGVDLIKCLENADDTDVNTSTTHCTLCDKKYSNNSYRNHLVRFHYLRVPRKSFKSSDIVPVIDLLKRYCNVCDKTYKTMKIYRNHMDEHHHENIPRPKGSLSYVNRDGVPVIDEISLYCTVCDKKYKQRRSYGCHLKAIHGLQLPERRGQRIKNNHCIPCNITCSNRTSFARHWDEIHNTTKKKSTVRTTKKLRIKQEDTNE